MHGIAYTKDYDKDYKERIKRLRELEDLNLINIERKKEDYKCTYYYGSCSGVTEDDICIWCGGCVPFGAKATISNNQFICKVWND